MNHFLNEIINESNSESNKYYSLNNENSDFLKCDYKVVIVGTITSRYKVNNPDNLFYYVSKSGRNNMYRMLSRYFDEHGEGFDFQSKIQSDDFYAIKQRLIKAGIIFLDVIKSCESSTNTVSSDNHLSNIALDYDSFKKISTSVLLIANSKNAYFAALKILQKLGKNNDLIYLPIFYRYKYEDWRRALLKAGILVKH